MAAGRSKDVVAAAALLGALGFGSFLFLRARGALDASWTDGTRRFASATDTSVRHAVWDRPEELPELGEARDPALSPDGRWLVFASGARGLNAELFVAELVDGTPREPEPLVAVNSAADELAPAFGDGALWFASDRPGGAGGLDLWRAPYAAGEFGAPERLAPGLNSAADETDPAPEPGGGALVFASNRARADFDLYRAAQDAESFYLCEPLAALNSTNEERGPAFSADPRSLTFASDRGGAGADLYRALRNASGWGPPAPIAELSTPRAEEGPALSADGFALWFTREEAGGSSLLARARSLEIFRVLPPAVTLAQWLALAGLLLLALLALLAKRWTALDVLYKCVLVSLVLHLLLMLLFQRVFPDAGSFDTGGAETPGGETQAPDFRVRAAPPEDSADGLGPSVQLAPDRQPFRAEAERAEAPATAQLAAPLRPEERAPTPTGELARADAELPATELSAPAEANERYASATPSLALEASAAAAPGPRAERGPMRAEDAPPSALSAVAPAAAALTARELGNEALAAGAAHDALRPTGGTGATDPELATPQESFERAGGTAPELALAASAARERSGSGEEQPAREAVESAPLERARPSGAGAALASRASASPLEAAGSPARAPLVTEAGAGSAVGAAPELRAPAEGAPAAPATAAAAFDATAGLGGEPSGAHPSAQPARTAAAPARAASDARGASLVGAPAPAAAPHELARASEPASAPAPGRTHAEPRADGEKTAAAAPPLRAPAAEPAPRPAKASASTAFDATAGLEVARAPTRAAPNAPGRATLEAAAKAPLAPPAPAPAHLDGDGAARAHADPLDTAPPPRVAETPYQNRFGAQKLRALEEFGGTPETEHAVAAGLAYLAHIQESSGAWGQRSDQHEKYLDVRIGKSALALLAFLGAGHVPGGDTEHAAVAERTVQYLLDSQDPATGHFGLSCSYGHGIATYALAECFALGGDERLRAPLERALGEILRNQNTQRDPRLFGGWGYYFPDGHVWNGDDWPRTSVTSWQVMALESARLGGLAVPDQAFANAREFLLATWDPRAKAFRYDHDPARLDSGYPILPASTPAALFALSLLGVDPAAEELGAARRFVLVRAPDGYRYTGADDFVRRARGNLYFWYYATLAMFRVGGTEWERWNQALQETLLPAQAANGSWRPLDTYSEYAGDDDDERTYSTAMCVLSLEVYYRYFTPLLRVR